MPATNPRAYQVYDIDWKQAVRALSDTNINLASPGALVIDAVVLNPYDRVLLTAQTNATQNGIYQVNAARTLLVPAPDWVNINSGLSSAVNSGLTVSVTAGAEYAQTTWTLTTPNPIVIGTTTINFARTPDQISNVAIDGTTIELANNASETSISIRPSGTGGLVGITVPDDATANVANLHIYNLVANGNVKISTTGGNWLFANSGSILGTGNISAGYFVGNGSQLTGISALGSFIANGTSTVDIGTVDGNVVVTTDGANAWTFDTAGNLTMPGSLVAETAGNTGSLRWEINGSNLNVLKLIPDDNLVPEDRYVVIDPYNTGHIHIRAGGIQDASNSYLYLGGEDVHVEVDDFTKEIRVKTYNVVGSSAYQFSFANDGHFQSPNGIITGGNLSVSGNAQAQYFIGNGALLTGISAGSSYSNANVVAYGQSGWGGNIIPNANATYSLGNATNYWANLWVANNTIYIGGVPLGITAGNVLTVGGNAVLSNGSNTSISTTGNISANYFFGNGSQLTGINVSTSSISNGNSNVAIATANGNVTVAVAGARTWTFDTTGNVTIPGNIVGTATIDIDNRATGNGADIQLYSADDILLQARDRSAGSTSEGGDINIFAGDSAEDGDVSGGDIVIEAGGGGASNIDFGGSGGFVRVEAGQGGNAIGANFSARSGGDLTLRAGDAGTNNGNIDLGNSGGDVIINAGDSTGNGDPGGTIYLTSGAADASALAGDVVIQAGGTWTFDGDGNLNLPMGGVVYETNIPDGGLSGSAIALKPTGGTNADQELLIYPTVNDANHLHLTTGNLYNTELFLGDDNLYVKLANTGNIVVNANNNTGNSAQWTFGTNGNLTLPGNIIAINYADGNRVTGGITFSGEAVIGTGTSNTQSGLYLAPDPVSLANDLYLRVRGNILDEPTHIHFDTGNNQYYNQFIGDDNKYIQLANTGNIVINSNDNAGNSAQWIFGANGNLTVPGGIVGSGASPAPYLSGFSSVSAINLSASGNITASGNLIANVGITTVGNVTGNYFIGNGSQLTGLSANYSNANVADYLPTYTGNIAGNIVKSGYTWTFSNTGTTTFPTGVTLSNARGPNTVNFLTGVDKSFQIETQTNVTSKLWNFTTDGNLTLPQNGNINFSNGVNILSNLAGTYGNANVANFLAAYGSNTIVTTGNITAGNLIGNISITGNVQGTTANVTLIAGSYNWTFDNTGNLTLPGNTFSVNYANNTPVDVVTRFESSWTVPVGNSTQSFTVTASNTYYMWVDCNIPNGILVWNATGTVTNTNVPVVGYQYAWVYNGGGTPIDFTSIPNQFIGTANTIVRSNVAPSSTTNRFDFGINNTSGGNVTVRYGWIQIS
jgi:hypothetical protein